MNKPARFLQEAQEAFDLLCVRFEKSKKDSIFQNFFIVRFYILKKI